MGLQPMGLEDCFVSTVTDGQVVMGFQMPDREPFTLIGHLTELR